MTSPTADRRVPLIIALVGVVLFSLYVEQGILIPGIEAMEPADEVAYWEEHVARNSEYAESRIRLGLAYQKDQRFDEALSEYETALMLNPDSEEATIGRYAILSAKGEGESALAGLASYSQNHPRCGICWQNLASAYLNLGRLDEAESAVEALLESPLRFTSGMYSAKNLHFEAEMVAGRVYAERGDYERAIELIRDATLREPRDVRGYVLQAKIYVASGRPDEALEVLNEAENVLAPGDVTMRQEIQRLRRKARRRAAPQ